MAQLSEKGKQLYKAIVEAIFGEVYDDSEKIGDIRQRIFASFDWETIAEVQIWLKHNEMNTRF